MLCSRPSLIKSSEKRFRLSKNPDHLFSFGITKSILLRQPNRLTPAIFKNFCRHHFLHLPIYLIYITIYIMSILSNNILLFPYKSMCIQQKRQKSLPLLNASIFYKYFFNASTLSNFSQGRSRSFLPKCP